MIFVNLCENAGEVGRSLKMMSVDDYSDATANHGHDPRNRNGGGNGNAHRTHDNP